MPYVTIGSAVYFYDESDVLLFTARSDVAIAKDMIVRFTPTGGSETRYEVVRVELSVEQLSTGDSDHEARYKEPIMKVYLRE